MNGIERIIVVWRGGDEEVDYAFPTDQEVLGIAEELIKNIRKNMS